MYNDLISCKYTTYICIPDYNDSIQVVNLRASSGINQMTNYSVSTNIIQCVTDDEALSERAEGCCIECHRQLNKRRSVYLQGTTTDELCKCLP